MAASSLDGIEIRSEDALTLAGWIFEYLKSHPYLLDMLVYSVVFLLVSVGIARMIRSWRVRQ